MISVVFGRKFSGNFLWLYTEIFTQLWLQLFLLILFSSMNYRWKEFFEKNRQQKSFIFSAKIPKIAFIYFIVFWFISVLSTSEVWQKLQLQLRLAIVLSARLRHHHHSRTCQSNISNVLNVSCLLLQMLNISKNLYFLHN